MRRAYHTSGHDALPRAHVIPYVFITPDLVTLLSLSLVSGLITEGYVTSCSRFPPTSLTVQ